jgi:nicotinamide-nucleotide amidase
MAEPQRQVVSEILPASPSASPLAFAQAAFADAVEALVEPLGAALRARSWRLATAESCTGGLLAAACTSIAGSSDWFERGFVTYSNAAKHEMLGVPVALIEARGAVSQAVAEAMALGALARSGADLALATTGIAGPGGAVPGKPVGTVWLAWAWRRAPEAGPAMACSELLQCQGDRAAVRSATLVQALRRLTAVTDTGAERGV